MLYVFQTFKIKIKDIFRIVYSNEYTIELYIQMKLYIQFHIYTKIFRMFKLRVFLRSIS